MYRFIHTKNVYLFASLLQIYKKSEHTRLPEVMLHFGRNCRASPQFACV